MVFHFSITCDANIYRDDEEEETKQFPIVKESAAELIKQGINTLQKTLLLRKEVEVEKVKSSDQNRNIYRDNSP